MLPRWFKSGEAGTEFIVSVGDGRKRPGRSKGATAREGQKESGRKSEERHDGVIRRMRSPRSARGGSGGSVMADEGLDGSRDKLRRNRRTAHRN